MNCNHARRLYAAYWDDETTQAEREWLEGHFTSCAACRAEYEHYARTLEVLGSLPRVEPSPDLHDRVLQRVRRADSVPDRMPVARPIWVPIASGAAAVVLLAVTLAGPWLGGQRDALMARRANDHAVSAPVRVQLPTSITAANGRGSLVAAAGSATTDSLFDHSEDVEFILDPVTLHRGRASVNRGSGAPGEKAVITF